MRGEERNLFVYGTLMVPAVMQAVTGRSFRSVPATLGGYARYFIKRQVYPGIIARENFSVDGLLYYAIDAECMQRLDIFESEVYRRSKVLVKLADGSEEDAFAYIVSPQFEHLLSGNSWDLEQFKQQHLPRYLAGI